MTYITTVEPDAAGPEVAAMYAHYEERLGYLPNYARAFSLRPAVMAGWMALLGSVTSTMDPRRYELVTLAAASALRSSYCSLAHGKVLRDRYYSAADLAQIAGGDTRSVLEPLDRAIMAHAEQVARDATAIEQKDIDGLRGFGLSDAEIFDITAAAAARCFFSKMLDALGAEPDSRYLELEETMRAALTVGRPIEGQV